MIHLSIVVGWKELRGWKKCRTKQLPDNKFIVCISTMSFVMVEMQERYEGLLTVF